MKPVSFVKAENTTDESIRDAIRKSVSLIEFNFDRKIHSLIIKPNMCYYYHPSTGEVTDPRFVSLLIDVLRENFRSDPQISIVESDASALKCKFAFKMFKYDKLAEEKGVKLINLCEEPSKQIDLSINGHSLKFSIPEILSDCDLLVNVPKIKYMPSVKITCALKNIFGCNAVQKKSVYHVALSEAVVGMNKLVKTGLVVFDGLVVNGRTPKRLNLVMASEDVVAADAAASQLMGLNPKSVKQITLAMKENLGSANFKPVGDFAYFQQNFPKKKTTDKMFDRGAHIYLKIFH